MSITEAGYATHLPEPPPSRPDRYEPGNRAGALCWDNELPLVYRNACSRCVVEAD